MADGCQASAVVGGHLAAASVSRGGGHVNGDLDTNGNLVTHGHHGVGRVQGHLGSGHVPIYCRGGSVTTTAEDLTSNLLLSTIARSHDT